MTLNNGKIENKSGKYYKQTKETRAGFETLITRLKLKNFLKFLKTLYSVCTCTGNMQIVKIVSQQ